MKNAENTSHEIGQWFLVFAAVDSPDGSKSPYHGDLPKNECASDTGWKKRGEGERMGGRMQGGGGGRNPPP